MDVPLAISVTGDPKQTEVGVKGEILTTGGGKTVIVFDVAPKHAVPDWALTFITAGPGFNGAVTLITFELEVPVKPLKRDQEYPVAPGIGATEYI